MMFERFDTQSGTVVVQAREEARLLGATRLEAEHLLLALARQSAWDAGRVLADAGLDHDGLGRALDAEVLRSLASVGVTPGATAIADRPVPTTREPRWGTSAKRAIRRALDAAKARGDRSIHPTHLLLGVLRAEEGTVPRALATSRVDRTHLVASAEATLDAPLRSP
jgi:ATP-dependent Clp protease ATP-binding subunit ClpA